MGIKFKFSKLAYSLSSILTKPSRKNSSNFLPGKMALKFDADLISKLKEKKIENSVVVVGTNGKNMTTNLIADLLESQGSSVISNRTGANLDSGVVVALKEGKKSQWGVFDCDELYLYKVAYELSPDYIILTNIFPEQTDKLGRIFRVQEHIIHALKRCPKTWVIYNADDPNCQYILDQVDNERISFGVEGDKPKDRGNFIHSELCPECSAVLEYSESTFDQLGIFTCKSCSFKSQTRDFLARDIKFSKSEGNSFSVYSNKFKRNQFRIK